MPGLPRFGIITRLTGMRAIAAVAELRPSLGEEAFDPDRGVSMCLTVTLSTPAERAPRLLATRLHASRRLRGWVTQFHMSR